MVARGKGYLTNHQPPPSSLLPSSEVPASTNDDNNCGAPFQKNDIIGGEATENVAAACDKSFSFPRFDVLQITPEDHHYLDDANQVIFYF
jgi:hypothetical protein